MKPLFLNVESTSAVRAKSEKKLRLMFKMGNCENDKTNIKTINFIGENHNGE